MSSILTSLTSVVSEAADWVGTMAGTITASGNEILLVPIGMLVAGFGVGLIRRLINIK